MKKLKQLQDNKKINSNVGETRVCKQDISFSFTYLTTNNKYNFKSCDDKDKLDLLIRLEELSKHELIYWMNLGKKNGTELLPVNEIKFKPNNIILSSDQKAIVFRFGKGKNDCRLICIKTGNCPILHIIGFDTNFKAYNHGS